jgi:zinc protease
MSGRGPTGGGAPVLVEENHDLPLVRLQAALRIGAADDPEEQDGLANFATELYARGAAGRSRAEIDAAFDALGTHLDVMTEHDSVTFELTVLKEHADRALALLGDVLTRPDCPAAEADKLKRELSAQLDELREDDAQLVSRFLRRALFGRHPYGRSVIGTEASLRALDVAAARRWHARLGSGDVVFGAAGDLERREAEDLFARHFGSFAKSVTTELREGYPDVPRRRGVRLTIVDKPERTQSQILFAQPAPAWAHPDFLPLSVGTHAFGGTFTARLMEEVRSKRGLSYGASARLHAGRGARALLVNVFPSLEQTAETIELVLRLYREWATDGLTNDEVIFSRGNLAEGFAFSLATPDDRLELRTAVEVAGLPLDYPDTYVDRVRAVDAAAVRRAMQTHLSPNDLEICVVATADALRPRLEEAGLLGGWTVDVVPADSY